MSAACILSLLSSKRNKEEEGNQEFGQLTAASAAVMFCVSPCPVAGPL